MEEQNKKGPDVSNVNLDESGKFELDDKELDEVAGGLATSVISGGKTVFVGCAGGTKTVRTGCI